jgi:hypothetical protein
MAEDKETWFDRWLDAPGHDGLKHWYLTTWLTWEMRVRTFFRFRRRFKDWRWERQFKVGGYFLDHGNEPSIITEISDGAVRGKSLVDDKWVVSDFYACGPAPCTEYVAECLAERIKWERDNAVRTTEPS